MRSKTKQLRAHQRKNKKTREMNEQTKNLQPKESEAKEEAGAQAIASKANKKKKTQKSPSTSPSFSPVPPASPEQGLLHQVEEKEERIETELELNEISNENNDNNSRNSSSFIIEDVEVGDSDEKEDGRPISSFLKLSPASNVYPDIRQGKGKEGRPKENAMTSSSPTPRKGGLYGNLEKRDLCFPEYLCGWSWSETKFGFGL